ncbi:P1 family peptidase [soil metagenome]
MLHPDRRLSEVHAVLLTGGSAFGLAAAEGVVGYLEERGIGYRTSAAVVPIVPAAVVFDLATGRAEARPGPAAGRAACEGAVEGGTARGAVGAGTGATVGKWAGREHAVAGGVGFGYATAEGLEVRALAVVNCVGDVLAPDGSVLAGTGAAEPGPSSPGSGLEEAEDNTVLAVVAVKAALDKPAARWLAARGSDGITVTVRPAHTRYDGDVVFAITAPPLEERPPADLDILGPLTTQAVAAAVRDGVAR